MALDLVHVNTVFRPCICGNSDKTYPYAYDRGLNRADEPDERGTPGL